MTRQDTQVIKGVAILLMLFLHLFNHNDNFSSLLFINGKPFVYILSRACNPVSFYLILGGVGLYSVRILGRGHFKDNLKRIFKLYIHYWIILLIFITIGHFIRGEKYPGSITVLFANLIGISSSYNGQSWFLFPYSMLALTAPFLFKLLDKYEWKLLFCTLTIGLCTSFVISHYGQRHNLYDKHIIYNLILYFHLMFPFLLGASIIKYDYGNIIKKFKMSKWLIWMIIFLFVFFECMINSSILYSLYALAIILCIIALPKCEGVKYILIKLGDHSMNMWLIHTWFAYYLFHDFIYCFKYPIIIFLILVIISYLSSMLVNFIANPIVKRIT